MDNPEPTAPVAFFVFNRPDCTERVLGEIRRIRPGQLLVVADGPRISKAGEDIFCERVREIIQQGVDWPCELLTNYSQVNLGCRDRVVSGLDWVFTKVEHAIILEDDCLPDMTFFQFATELLERYSSDRRVSAISGINFQNTKAGYSASYYFSTYPHIWGWATWRRVWEQYDVTLRDWPATRSVIAGNLANKDAEAFFSQLFDRCKLNKIDTWDYQLCYLMFRNHGLTIIPDRNLVRNIGFDDRATHTTDSGSRQADLKTFSMEFPLVHPATVEVNAAADAATVANCFTLVHRPVWRVILAPVRNFLLNFVRRMRG